MALRDDPHFGRSLVEAAALVGSTRERLKVDPWLNIRGTAALLKKFGRGIDPSAGLEAWEPAMARLSGIPQRAISQIYSYDVFNSINVGRSADQFEVTRRPVDLRRIYGADRLAELSGPSMTISNQPRAKTSTIGPASGDYPPAAWEPAASCNYTRGRSSAITHVAVHIMEGYYGGTISYFAACNTPRVSAHYLVAADGRITQMVSEADTAHHVANHNSYTIGIEHEGFANDPNWYTPAMYRTSKDLTRDIAFSRGIPLDSVYWGCEGGAEIPQNSRWRIKGHTNFPTTKPCPGQHWDWHRYRNLVLNNCETVNAINARWRALGGQCGYLGACTTNEHGTPDGRGAYTHFERGSIYWTAQTGAQEIYGAIRQRWAEMGWETSFLGYPTTGELGTPDGRGRFNHFERGSIYWTPQTGAHEVYGAIREKWREMGWETSYLGYPTTGELGTPDGIGRFNHFERGSIYWTPHTGAHSVQGAIRDRWASIGWERSCLGYPTTDELDTGDGGRISYFQGGYIIWYPSSGAFFYCD